MLLLYCSTVPFVVDPEVMILLIIKTWFWIRLNILFYYEIYITNDQVFNISTYFEVCWHAKHFHLNSRLLFKNVLSNRYARLTYLWEVETKVWESKHGWTVNKKAWCTCVMGRGELAVNLTCHYHTLSPSDRQD